ncbi:hypothetical protein SEPCBS57363_006042 [Sporothrix epigloea]|uniref:Proteasome inhibitor PI31 subunit n=1 Tax=Sporothrix epigloea TaxID=1892477 RepID=A0ABP0E0V8_9PEZI
MVTSPTASAGVDNPVGPAPLLATMSAVLPASTLLDDTGNALPDIGSPLDAIALFCHAFLASLGFRFQQVVHNYHSGTTRTIRGDIGAGEQDSNRLPPSWNDGSDEADLGFTYSLEDDAGGPVKSLNISIKASGATMHVSAVAIDSPALIGQMSVSVAQFLNTKMLPVFLPAADRSGSGDIPSSQRFDTLRELYCDADALSLLSKLFQFEIVQRLIPNLERPGYKRLEKHPDQKASDTGLSSLQKGGSKSEAHNGNSGSVAEQNYADKSNSEIFNDRANPPPFLEEPVGVRPPQESLPDPGPFVPDAGSVPVSGSGSSASRADPARPAADFPPPQFEDEHQMLRAPGVGGRGSGFGIGYDDLNPPHLGPRDPLHPSLTGSSNSGLRIGPGGFGGMHPTFDDPLFTGIRGQGGRGHNGEFDPQHPPGARWDEPGPAGTDPSGLLNDFGEDGSPPGHLGRGHLGGRGGGFGGGFGSSGGAFGGDRGGFGGFGGGFA